MIAKDDPEHLEQRRLVSAQFAPRSVQAMAPRLDELITEIVDDAVDAATRDGSVEVVDAVAAQLPSRLTALLLGFPEDRWPDIKSWSERLMRIDAAPTDMEIAMGRRHRDPGVRGRHRRDRDGAPRLPGRRPRVELGRRPTWTR